MIRIETNILNYMAGRCAPVSLAIDGPLNLWKEKGSFVAIIGRRNASGQVQPSANLNGLLFQSGGY